MVAGEASGDLLAAHLIAALQGAPAQPTLFAGIGGPRMMAQGFESHYPMEKLSVRGYAEVLRHYREIMASAAASRRRCSRERPDLFIGVDASDFNLGLERQLKDAGIPTVHYVSPSIWAWRGWRMQQDRALGEPHPGDVPVRAAALREGRACRSPTSAIRSPT